jgi:glycosyltransferase involved in cell wall biosynthesis
MLECLFTGFSLRRPPWLGRAIEALAPEAHRRLAQHRDHSDFSPRELRVFPLHLVASRLGPRWDHYTREAFARAAARLAVNRSAGVMAFDTNASTTFAALEGRGLPRILDQSIAHRRWRDRMGAEEMEAFPGWAASWDSWKASAESAARQDEEAARADLILCGSEFCARTMAAEGIDPRKLAVVEYGAETTRFTPPREPAEPRAELRLLFVGAVVLRKGIPYLLEAVKRVGARMAVKLTIAGKVRVRPEALVPYRDLITIKGTLLHSEMPELYRAHDVYVFPSLVEGSSLSIYEALASGLPVITTPNSGSIVRDGVEGRIVAARDVEGLVGAIETLARDRERRVEMGRAARRRAQEYGDWRHYGERLARALRATVAVGDERC